MSLCGPGRPEESQSQRNWCEIGNIRVMLCEKDMAPQVLSLNMEREGNEPRDVGSSWKRKKNGSPLQPPEFNIALPILEFRGLCCTFTQQRGKVIHFYWSCYQDYIYLLQQQYDNNTSIKQQLGQQQQWKPFKKEKRELPFPINMERKRSDLHPHLIQMKTNDKHNICDKSFEHLTSGNEEHCLQYGKK